MASSFAAQLSQIAAKSSSELDLKAQKAAYAQSLIFDKRIAGSQDIQSIYQICLEGFRELCQLDARFGDFERSLFSPQSMNQDRRQMTTQENEALDSVVGVFLGLVGSKLLLRPAIKAVEWLVRRFQVHLQNTSLLLCTFLPYHETPIFRNLLSILPTTLPSEFKFLSPYWKTATNPPKHAIAYGATVSDALFTTLNKHTIQICRAGTFYPLLMSFWGSIVVEAVAARVVQAQSGRKEVQEQRQEDVLLKILPLLSDGLSVPDAPDLALVCYTLTMILASKCSLADRTLLSLMEAVAGSLDSSDELAGLTCLVVLANRMTEPIASKMVVRFMMQIQGIQASLQNLAQKYSVDRLVQALLRGALDGLKKSNYLSRISFVESLLRLSATSADNVFAGRLLLDVLEKVREFPSQGSVDDVIKARLVDMLRNVGDSNYLLSSLGRAVQPGGLGVSEIESMLGSVLTPQIEQAPTSEAGSDMDLDLELSGPSDKLDEALSHLPERTVDQQSFLVSTPTHLFEQLDEAFQLCCKQQNSLGRFESLPIWRSSDPESPLYLSFLIRVACSFSNTTTCRSFALRLVARDFSARKSPLDGQVLLPYITTCLADSSRSVREAASEVIIAMLDASPKNSSEAESCPRLGARHLYDSDSGLNDDQSIPSHQLSEIIRGVYLPVLEECVLESAQVGRALHRAFNGSVAATRATLKPEAMQLKKSLRHSLFDLLTRHILATPLLGVKVELIRLLDGVEKVGSTSKSKVLSPLLLSWTDLDASQATELVHKEGLNLAEVDHGLTLAISTSGREVLSQLLKAITEGETKARPDFVQALFDRLTRIWRSIKPEQISAVASKLFELSMSQVLPVKHGARNVLGLVELPTDALMSVLEQVIESTTELQEGPPTKRQKRMSNGQSGALTLAYAQEFHSTVTRLTFALELIESSTVQNRPELIGELFQTLSLLQFLRKRGQGQLPYLLRLCLSSILAIVEKQKQVARPSFDFSAVRTELVIDCVREAENPQVQTTALLLVAALATLDPGHILHSVMPIFTFMSNSVLAKDDEHSINVTNQTMDQVIPPLVEAVRQKDVENLIRPMSDLLSSFVAAYDHVPQHRRLGLFERLLSRLGSDDFAYATIGMLATRKTSTLDLDRFLTELMESFDAGVQLITCRKLLALVGDIFSSQSGDAEIIAAVSLQSSAADKHEASLILISTAVHIFKSKTLKSQVSKINKLDQEVAKKVRDELRTGFHVILELMRTSAGDDDMQSSLSQCLEKFLALPPLVEYFDGLPTILQEVDKSFRVDVLRALEMRLSTPPAKNTNTQTAAIAFLSILTQLLNSDDDPSFKVAAISCIDRMAELYGRKDIPSIVGVTASLLQVQCLGAKETQLRIAALLCIASLVEIMKEAVIPLVPELMPRTFELLEESMIEDVVDSQTHNACFSLLSAMVSHVPFMISDEYLDNALSLSAESANAEADEDCNDARRQFLHLLSRKIAIQQLVTAFTRTWTRVVENDVLAVLEALELLGDTTKHSSKSTVVKTADVTSNLILQVMDLRHIQLLGRSEDSYQDAEVLEIESSLHQVMMKFIYKLNDNTFRPLFSQWVDWAVDGTGIAHTGLTRAKMLRQTSLFNFMTHFFTTLKSIVTAYMSYVLVPAVEVLKAASSGSEAGLSSPQHMDIDEIAQYKASLAMITAAASNDQDSFFASPSHFTPLHEVLIAQLSLAASKDTNPLVYQDVLPAIAALATAVADTPAHHVSMNKLICRLRNSDSAGVRMASIKCQAYLTANEEMGEEWVNNIVSGGGEAMVYVNEMLEDDDENVEKEVRKWVRRVREMVGEDVFEN